MFQKNSNLKIKLKIKRWIWVAYILFHSSKYQLYLDQFKQEARKPKRGTRSPIEQYSRIIKGLYGRLRNFGLRNRHFINEKHFIFIKIKRDSLSTMLYLVIGIKWFCEKAQINVGFHFVECDDFFENSLLASSEKKCREISGNFTHFRNTNLLIYCARTMIPSEYGHKIISKLKVKEELQQQASVWIDNNLRGDWLAVHYRGTDARKANKYRVIRIENYIAYLKKVLDDHSSIFACSDQSQFIDQIHAAFPGRVFSRDIQRSDDTTPLHRKSEYTGNQQKQDALIDLLVLSRASLIYATGSYFIDVSRFLNPAIKIISLDGRGKFYKNIPNYLPIPNLSALKRCKRKRRD